MLKKGNKRRRSNISKEDQVISIKLDKIRLFMIVEK